MNVIGSKDLRKLMRRNTFQNMIHSLITLITLIAPVPGYAG